jgi:hypothetical protein
MWCGQDSNWGKGVEGSGSELRIEREDGVVLAASWTLSERLPAPALVALHGAQPGLSHHLHATLPSTGFAVVTFDRRGEGASRHAQVERPSSTIVTGPSLTSSTSIRAPKTPVSTSTPSARRASQKRS